MTVRMLHVYAHLIYIALAEGIGEDLNALGFGDTQYWHNAMVFHIRVVLDLDRFVDF